MYAANFAIATLIVKLTWVLTSGDIPAEDKTKIKPIVISMSDCTLVRPGRANDETSTLSIIFSGPPKDKMKKKGVLEVDGQKFNIYLPESKVYRVANPSKTEDAFSNKSTLISIDGNNDGKLTDDESWFASLPIRVGDQMFEVLEIAKDGSSMSVQRSAAKLQGASIGRKCPDFTFETMDGQKTELKDFSGKVLILDIWSVT